VDGLGNDELAHFFQKCRDFFGGYCNAPYTHTYTLFRETVPLNLLAFDFAHFSLARISSRFQLISEQFTLLNDGEENSGQKFCSYWIRYEVFEF
jgi:uncharacterized membrane protein YjdF